MVFDAVQQAAFANHVDAGITELAQLGTFNLAAQLLGHGLHAVADTENRYAQVKYSLWGARAAGFVYRLRATGQDDAFRGEFADRCVVHVERVQFAVNADFAHAASDQLGVLGTEVQDQDAVSVNVEGHDKISINFRNDTGLNQTAPVT